MDAALALHPDTENLALVAGSSGVDRFYEENARAVLREYEGRFGVIDLTGLAMDDLLTRVARLPEKTVGLYLLTLKDAAGEEFVPQKILPRISQNSNAPLYGLWDASLEHGIVGGYLEAKVEEGRRSFPMISTITCSIGANCAAGASPSGTCRTEASFGTRSCRFGTGTNGDSFRSPSF